MNELNDTNIGIGFSDRVIIGISIVGFTMLAYTIHSIMVLRKGNNNSTTDDDDDAMLSNDERLRRANVQTLNRAQRRARAKVLMKEQRRLPTNIPPVVNNTPGVENDDMHHVQQDIDNNHMNPHPANPSRKVRQQMAKATEKEERRLYGIERQNQQKDIQDKAQQQKKERLLLQQQRIEQEHQEKAMHYQKQYEIWNTFLVSNSTNQNQPTIMSVPEFIQQCQQNRVVDIEVLATTYHISTHDIIQRIQQLLNEYRLCGYFQNEYTFIYISDDDREQITKIIGAQTNAIPIQQIQSICEQVLNS